jgi:hypothetical protein
MIDGSRCNADHLSGIGNHCVKIHIVDLIVVDDEVLTASLMACGWEMDGLLETRLFLG